MTVGIQFVGQVDGGSWIRVRGCPLVGQWLKAYDPEARDGIGECEFTEDPGEAMRFATADHARACWGQTTLSGSRPLTALNIRISALI